VKLMKPEPMHSSCEETSRSLVLTIPGNRSVFIKWYMTLGFFVFCGLVIPAFLRLTGPPWPVLLVMVVSAIGFVAFLIHLWFGRERVEITDTSLTHWFEPIPWRRRRGYDLGHVRRLRASATLRLSNDLYHSGALAFDYGARTIRLGTGIDEAEASMLIDVIARRFPQLAPATR
jgi:hypothetical protein